MMDELPTQADRDAAAAYWKVSMIGSRMTQELYKSGAFDASLIVQAFARHRIASNTEAADLISELAQALRALIPTNVCDNPNIENDYNFPCDITMGELRQAWDALAKATQ